MPDPADHPPVLPIVPDPPALKSAFWSSQTGRLLLWAANILVITVTFIAVSWISIKSGIPVPMPITPPPVVELPAPPPSVEAPTQFYCGRVESYRDAITTKPWPVKTITWTVSPAGYRGNISPLQIREAFAVAWASWGAYLDLEFKYTDSENDALVVSKFGDIDGSGRVLAWSELADGTTTAKQQLYDAGEKWEISATPTQIDVVRVAAHEIGHALGLTHDDEGSGALMAPIYSRDVRFPTTRDVKRLLTMGYKAKPVAPGTPPTIPPLSITIDAKAVIEALEKAGYTVQKK